MLSGVTAEEAEQLKAQGNERFRRRDYRGALEKYNAALGGEDGRGNGMQMGLSTALLNNRAACYLELADAMKGFGQERADLYHRAEYDAEAARAGGRMLGGSSKALFRLGRAMLGKQKLRSQLVDTASQQQTVGAMEALNMRKGIAKAVDIACMQLRSALEMQPGDAMVTGKLEEAQNLQQALSRKGAPPIAQMILPVPRPEAFGPTVVFLEGDSWMHNRVALELPVDSHAHKESRWSGTEPPGTLQVMLPIYLSKQENDNNRGELAIWMHYSEHLGKQELDTRGEAAFGEDAQYDVFEGNPYGNLSTPAQADDQIRSPDEFVMDFSFARHDNATYSALAGIPAALVAAGVIERVRVAGHTGFGEAFVIYRVKF